MYFKKIVRGGRVEKLLFCVRCQTSVFSAPNFAPKIGFLVPENRFFQKSSKSSLLSSNSSNSSVIYGGQPQNQPSRMDFRFFSIFDSSPPPAQIKKIRISSKSHSKSLNLISPMVQICRSRRELFYAVLNVSGDLLGVEIEPKHCPDQNFR